MVLMLQRMGDRKMSDEYANVWTRFSASEYELLENYRRSQPKIPPIAVTVRNLVAIGLKAEQDRKQPVIKDTA
jgi:hypothetical protein